MMQVRAHRAIFSVALVLAVCGVPARASAAEPASAAILDENSLWRTFKVFRHPSVRMADGKLERKQVVWYWGALKTQALASPASAPLPAADWAGADFDDNSWPRCRLPLAKINYDTGLIILRGRFEVKDPAQVKELNLALSYYGGVAVLVNGKEVARGNLPGDPPSLESLAEDYPAEAVTTPEGKALRAGDQKNKDRLAARERKLADVKIPAVLLRKGTNVLAIEVHAAPVPEVVFKLGDTHAGWPPIGPLTVRLTASPAGSVAANSSRPNGIQLWTCPASETVTTSAYGDPCEPLRPMTVAAAPNGVFSGRLLVGSPQALKGLKLAVGDLAQAEGGGKIPVSAVRVRCAAPGLETAYSPWVPPDRFDALLEAIPAEIPVRKTAQAPGAVAALWLTVRVPKDAKPGKYAGTVTVSAEGLTATAVPLKLTVYGFPVPDVKDFRMKTFGQVSPDSLAKHYEAPLWSDKHFELIGKSMALMAEVNSRQAIADLAINFYGGNKGGVDSSNEESMVRWIKQPDGSYKHDFAVFDKYLDMVNKVIGKPLPLRLNCWGEWVKDTKQNKWTWSGPSKVSLLDPATGKLDQLEQPGADTPEFVAFWKPVLDEARKKIEARGWFDVATVGHNSYCYGPHAVVVDAYRKIWPDGLWSYTAHNGTAPSAFAGSEKGVSMRIFNADAVWTRPSPTPRGYARLLKPRQGYWCFTYRGTRDPVDPATIRLIPNGELLSGLDGWSDFGVDFFPVKIGPNRYRPIGNGRGTGGPNDGTLALLAPGPDGAVATERFEMLREGLQVAEAILFLQKAVEDKKLAGDLEQRVNRCLDERGEAIVRDDQCFMVQGWFGYADRMEQDEKLLALAGEAAAALQGR